MKKVLIVSTSPRKSSNSEALAVAFAEGAKEALWRSVMRRS